MKMRHLLRKRESTLALFLFGMCLLVSLRAPGFLAPKNLDAILNDTCALIVVALGQLLVILIGGIDLSVASTMAFAGMTAALLNQHHPGIPAALLLPAGAAAGALLGGLTGSLVAYGGLPPIIASIAAMSVYRGLVYVMSRGAWVTPHEMTEGFLSIPNATFLGITSMVWITLMVVLATAIALRLTPTGRDVYALGSHRNAARTMGVSERRVEMTVFMASGLLSGLVGVLWVSRYGVAHSETAVGFELQSVAACVLGGVQLTGGAGTVLGVVMGALFFGAVSNALTVIHISPFCQLAVQGFVILFAIVSNTLIGQRHAALALARRGR